MNIGSSGFRHLLSYRQPARALLLDIKSQWLKFLAALAQSLVIVVLFTILVLVVTRGLHYFWPQEIYKVEYRDVKEQTNTIYAYSFSERHKQEPEGRLWLHLDTWANPRNRTQIHLLHERLVSTSLPEELARIDFSDGRYLFAQPQYLIHNKEVLDLAEFSQLRAQISALRKLNDTIVNDELVPVNASIAQLRARGVDEDAPALKTQNQKFNELQRKIEQVQETMRQYQMHVALVDNKGVNLDIQDIYQISFPNNMRITDKLLVFKNNLLLFLTEDTRNANQAGGVFPAIFGTILMILLMTVIVAPLGVVAAIYLTEYAPNNVATAVIRLSVSNLAAVPSVVYGVFGLGFFVYQLGGSIDTLFYADKLPTPTFGSPGILWASLTMALLTLPVVIIATEEGLRRVPQGLRKASYALGATRYETIRRIVLPVASSSLMTGVILAVARAAGEVAPMLMVGAVKYAPELPVDGDFPFLHLERQFMHLGVLIFDGAFHGQSTQQGAGIMFASCLFLLTVVLILNIIAISVRTRLNQRYGY